MKADPAALTQAAQKYRDNHHWVPLRLEGKDPSCMGKGWGKRTLASAIPKFKAGDNIGILLGAPSGDIVRLDPDFPAVPAVTEILFPEPTLLSGRKNSPRSGRLYICNGLKSRDFVLPSKGMKDDPRLPLHDGKPSLIVFQLLSTGKQHMAPPSIHPDSGEEIVWENDIPLATLDAKELLRRVGIEAFLLTVRHFWPARGKRNKAAMALARVLLEALATHYANEAERVEVVDALVLAVAMAGGDGEASRNGKERAAATLEKMKAGEETTGLSRLVELLELPTDVGKTFRKWLSVTAYGGGYEAGDLPADDKSTIVIREGALSKILNRAEAALMSAGIPIYQRGGELVMALKVGNVAMQDIKRSPGATVLHSVDASWLVRKLSDVIKWVRVKKVNKKLVSYPADPPSKYAISLITSRDVWKFPQLRGVILAPTLSPKGDIIETPGYHAGSGLLLDFKAGEFPPVPQRPTKADALAALKKLEHPLRKFPFVGENEANKNSASRSVALSGQLTAFVRASLRTSPLHGYDSPVAGTGKSLLAESPGLLANGAKPASMAQGRNPEEDEKRLSTVLHAGDNIIMIDNCQHQVTGDFLCTMLTQEVVQARILGLSERRILPCTALVVATGNNLTFAGDVTRRAVKCSLDAQIERPDKREFDFDFTKEILDNRPELVIAGLTVLRAYVLAGRPQPEKKLAPMGSFDDWAWVRGALVWLGQADPADTREAILEADPRKAELADVLTAWELAFGGTPKTLAEIGRDPTNEAIVALRVLLTEACGKPVWNARSAGWWMRRNCRRIVGGRCFVQDGQEPSSFWKIHYTNQAPKDETGAKKLPWEDREWL